MSLDLQQAEVSALAGVFQTFVSADPHRAALRIQNNGTDPIYVYTSSFGTATEGASDKIEAGAWYETFTPPSSGPIQIAADSTASGPVSVTLSTSVPSVLKDAVFGDLNIVATSVLGVPLGASTEVYGSSNGDNVVFWAAGSSVIAYDTGAGMSSEDISGLIGGRTIACCNIRPSNGKVYVTATDGTVFEMSVGSSITMMNFGSNVLVGYTVDISGDDYIAACASDDDRILHSTDTNWGLATNFIFPSIVSGFGYKGFRFIQDASKTTFYVTDEVNGAVGKGSLVVSFSTVLGATNHGIVFDRTIYNTDLDGILAVSGNSVYNVDLAFASLVYTIAANESNVDSTGKDFTVGITDANQFKLSLNPQFTITGLKDSSDITYAATGSNGNVWVIGGSTNNSIDRYIKG